MDHSHVKEGSRYVTHDNRMLVVVDVNNYYVRRRPDGTVLANRDHYSKPGKYMLISWLSTGTAGEAEKVCKKFWAMPICSTLTGMDVINVDQLKAAVA